MTPDTRPVHVGRRRLVAVAVVLSLAALPAPAAAPATHARDRAGCDSALVRQLAELRTEHAALRATNAALMERTGALRRDLAALWMEMSRRETRR